MQTRTAIHTQGLRLLPLLLLDLVLLLYSVQLQRFEDCGIPQRADTEKNLRCPCSLWVLLVRAGFF